MRVWFLFLCLTNPIFFWCQSNPKINHWTVLDGLADGNIHEIFKDSYGFLWIATDNGLNRFDGTTFRHYIHQLEVENGFRGSEVLGIAEDNRHRIWIGTEEGLNVYFHQEDSFHHIPTPRSNPNLASYSIPLAVAGDEIICWEITNHIVAYDAETLKRRILYINMPWPALRYYWLNQNAFQKGANKLWVPLNNYILEMDLSQKRVDSLKLPPEAGVCQSILKLEKDLLLGCTGGLFKFNFETGKTEAVTWAGPLRNKQINALNVSGKGDIWIGTEDEGLYFFNSKKQKFAIHVHDPNKPNSISSNSVYSLYADDHDILWAATGKKALDQVFPYEQAIDHFRIYASNKISLGSVQCFAEDFNQNIWVGTNGLGIHIFNPELGKTVNVITPGGGLSNNIRSIKMNKRGNKAWIGTASGMCKMSLPDQLVTRILFYDGEASRSMESPLIRHMQVQDDSTWLVATNKGVFSLAFEDDTARRLPHLKEDVFFIGKNRNVYSFSFWDYDPVLYRLQKGKWEKGEFPFSDITVGILMPGKPENIYWIGTDKGLIKTDSTFKRTEQFNKKHGLPDNRIWGLQHDAQGHLWITTNRGIARYNYSKNRLSSFGLPDGIQGLEYNPNAYLLAGDGTLYLGGKNGFDRIKTGLIRELDRDPGLNLYALRIQGPYEGSLKEKRIILKHDQNNFSIEATVIDYFNPQKSKVRFRLEPVEKEWQIENAPYTIRYAGLSPGKYTLLTSANNHRDEINEKGHKIEFLILSPFWRRAWFVACCSLLLAGGLYQIYHYRLNQVKKIYEVRTKISQDLHDEVGSALSGISLYSHLVKEQLNTQPPGQVQKSIDLIQHSALEMIHKLNDIVWFVNPEQDSLLKLLERLEEYARTMTSAKNIRFRIQLPEGLDDHKLPIQFRRNIYLICKEALNNAVKYSQAVALELTVKIKEKNLEFEIHDHGTGFDPLMARRGNGLVNMRKRAEEIGARLNLQSAKNEGTSVLLQLKIT